MVLNLVFPSLEVAVFTGFDLHTAFLLSYQYSRPVPPAQAFWLFFLEKMCYTLSNSQMKRRTIWKN